MERKCKDCGTKLSSYNRGTLCWPCQEKRKAQLQKQIGDSPHYAVDDLCFLLGYANPESVKRLGRKRIIPGRVPGIRQHLYLKAPVDDWIRAPSTRVEQAAKVDIEKASKAPSGSELADICQTEFAKLRLTSLLRPFLSESGHWVESPYEMEIRHHSGHSVVVTKISSSIRNTAEFSQLKARFPDHKIWSDFSEWEKQADTYIDAFQKWFTNQWNSVERGVVACYGESPRSYGDMFDLMARWADMANKGDMKDAINKMAQGLDRPKFQFFQTLIDACTMLACGIHELPPNPFWADELDGLAEIRATADSERPPVPKDFASHMDAEEFWDQVDEAKKLLALADKLGQTEATMIERLQKLASA